MRSKIPIAELGAAVIAHGNAADVRLLKCQRHAVLQRDQRSHLGMVEPRRVHHRPFRPDSKRRRRPANGVSGLTRTCRRPK